MSLVTPVYRAAEHVDELVSVIAGERDRWSELTGGIVLSDAIFVLDIPVDESAALLQRQSCTHPWLRIVKLSRNYGQHSASVAGIFYSAGDWVVTMGEDMQHDPRQIPALLKASAASGADIVYGQPKRQVHGGSVRDRASRGVKCFTRWLVGNRNMARFNSFRLLRGDVARAAASTCAQHTYLEFALDWYTDRVESVELDMVDQRFQQEKQSGYSFWRLVQHAKRMILTSDFRVLRYTTGAAGVSVLLAGLHGAWILYRKVFNAPGYDVSGWPSLALMILLFGGGSMLLLGLLIEFSHVIMLQLQGKPAFFVVQRCKDVALAKEMEKIRADADLSG